MARVRTMALLSVLLFTIACGGGGDGDAGSVPSAPTNVKAQSSGDTQITISWDASTSRSSRTETTTYILYMSNEDSGITKDNYATKNEGMKHENISSPFVHENLPNGHLLYFIVTGVNDKGESTESTEVSARVGETTTTTRTIPTTP